MDHDRELDAMAADQPPGTDSPKSPPAGSQLPGAEAIALTSLVDYADGSIVSRTLLSNEAGTLTLFAFDAGQALSEHTVPFDAVAQIVDGQAKLTVGGKVLSAREGELVLMPANLPHAVEATQRFKMLLTMLKDRP